MPPTDAEGHDGLRRQPRAQSLTAMDSDDPSTEQARRNVNNTALLHVQRVHHSACSAIKQVCDVL